METTNPIEICFCNRCLSRTRHQVAFCDSRVESDDYSGITNGNNFQVLQCQGCGNITYRTRGWSSAWMDEDGLIYTDTYYPPLISRKKPEWLNELPSDIKSVLSEVYIALHAESRYLATVGPRTVLDLLIVDKIGDSGSFKQKIKKLEDGGHITHAEAELIEAVIEAGSASAHRGYAPDTDRLNHVMYILE